MCINGKIISVRKKGEEFRQQIRTNCGNCVHCYTNRANAWAYRCYSHYVNSHNAYFLTLTLDETNITDSPCKRDIQLFHKRLRQFLAYHYPEFTGKLKYFLVSEYGYETERLHYHAIYYNLPFSPDMPYVEISNKFARIWGKGICYVKPFDFSQIYYCIKYLHKDKELGNIRLSSTELGSISEEMYWYMNTTNNFENIKVKIGYNKTVPMPRYFRKKYMTDEQKEKFCEYYVKKHDEEVKKCLSEKKLYNFERENLKFKKV